MNEKQFKPTRGSDKSLLQTAILLHETKKFNKLSVEEIYSILLNEQNKAKEKDNARRTD